VTKNLTKDETNHDIYHIAIDGPVASGKGTIARELSDRLGIPCLDTGAMYRGVAVYVRNKKLDENNEKAVTTALKGIKMDVEIKLGTTYVKVNGVDVTSELRDNDTTRISSIIATYPAVREFAIAQQQAIAKTSSFILEGRDIASAVLPNAKYKFYLTAKVKARAKRRVADFAAKGEIISLRDMMKQIKERDERDMTKGGLKQVPEAIVIDSTRHNNNVRKTVDAFMKHLINARISEQENKPKRYLTNTTEK